MSPDARGVSVAPPPEPVLGPDRRPVVEAPAGGGAEWARTHREALLATVDRHGSVLVRGLRPAGQAEVAELFEAVAGELMTDRESFAPRTAHGAGVYSSSAWPPDQPMCMHHELSHAATFPGLLLAACLRAPHTGGATALADSADVLAALPAPLVERLATEGWTLVRTYREDFGVSWREAFGTGDRAGVDEYCAANAVSATWLPDGSLRTRQHRPALVRHPVTGDASWFNAVAFLNEWTMAEEVRSYLVEVYGHDALPFNTTFGGGDPIGPDVVRAINEAYEAATTRQPWRDGDLLIVDNVRTAHSREAYTGPREVVVGLGAPVRLADCRLPGSPA